MEEEINQLGRWQPASITIVAKGKEYRGYPAPWSLLSFSLEWIKLHREC